MTVIEAIILGLVQGVTEFLPVSSSGHLVLLQRLLGIKGEVIIFDLALHVATLLAVCAVLIPELKTLLTPDGRQVLVKLAIATVPTVIIGVVFKGFFRSAFGGGYLGWGFMISAVLLLITDFAVISGSPRTASHSVPLASSLTRTNALITGIAQGAAILPGLSRSGTTVCTSLIMGASRSDAARFSFLMSIPVILGGMVFEAADIGTQTVTVGILPMIAGFVAAAVSGYAAVRFMLKAITKLRFYGYSVYLTVLAIVCFAIF